MSPNFAPEAHTAQPKNARGGKVAFWYDHQEAKESGLNVHVSSTDILHVGFRSSESKLVLNTCIDGEWERENNVIEKLTSGLYELDLNSPSYVTLYFEGRELLFISLLDRKISQPMQLHKIVAYGGVSAMTVDGEFIRGAISPVLAVHPHVGGLLSVFRGQTQGLIEALRNFDLQSYVDLNPDLHGKFEYRGEALVHFLREGVTQLRQFNDTEIFDPLFYTARYEDVRDLSPREAYAHWLSLGRREGRAPSEAKLLARLGLSFPEIPTFLTPERYAAKTLEPAGRFRTKWDAFEHWVSQITATGGLGTPLDEMPDAAGVYKELGDTQVVLGHLETATRLYWTSLLLDPARPQTWQHLGDNLLRRSNFAAAQHAYAQVAGLRASTYWTYRNRIKALQGMSRNRAAFDLANELVANYPDRAEARELVDELARELFDSNRQQAKLLAQAGLREEAVAVVRSTFRDVDLLDSPPVSPARTTPCRVLIFGTPYLRQCMFYRIEQKIEQLERAGVEVDFISQDEPNKFISAVGAYDVAIFYRVPALPDIEKAILYCRQIGVVTVYEIDDLVYDPAHFPDSIENYRGQLTADEYANLVVDAPLLQRAMALCDYGIASTPTLQRRIETVVARKKCFLHRNAMDSRHERFASASSTLGFEHRPGDVTLFYATGTKAHNEDFELFAAPAIADLFRSRPNVRLVVMGFLPLPSVLRPYESRIIQLPPVWDINIFWSTLAEADINLSVLKPGLISDCKSEIKWLEAAMLGIPSVVSATATFTEILSDGRDAMLADTVDSWRHKLSMLVDMPELRAKIGRAAKELAFSEYNLAAGADNIGEILKSILKDRPARPVDQAQKPLILLVNVFFWPQMIGGATRVLRDNLDHFLDHFGDEFDFQVFCATEGARTPYELRTYFYRGVRVTSVTHPMRVGMDWEPADDEMGRIFRAHIELCKPSLIHFHCIQRLSVCIAEAARELDIPYVVTAHDGWWISDHQFLVDEKGKVESTEAASSTNRLRQSGTGASAKINRSIRLRAALAGAERVLAVSAAFEQVYRAHGISNVRTVANGVSNLPKAQRRESVDGRVRLGFLGGISDHKGYSLIKRALLSTAFDNLHLTVVDHALGHGETRPSQIWGTTPVRIIGRVPQDEIMELYGNIDVLLAPSLWPESFGLVAREALMAGSWVVASNRGAMGEDVVPGVNGFVIDVSDTYELVNVLRQIDQEPARFLVPPALTPNFRKTGKQAEDLVLIYRQILFAEQRRSLTSAPEQSIA
jgi:glycosyltransferase involved in cell wall biosynthesis